MIEPSKRRYLLTLRGRDDLTPAERHELDMAESVYGHGWWLSAREAEWWRNAARLGEFCSENGRWPDSDADQAEERRLGTWLANARHASKHGTRRWTTERGIYLDRVAPGWRGENPDTAWTRMADEVATFKRVHGRWPSRAEDPAEYRLGQWLTTTRASCKKGISGRNAQRQNYLDTVAPGWRGDDDAKWLLAADRLAHFREQRDRWPSTKAGDVDERRLAGWLGTSRRFDRKGIGRRVVQRGAYLDNIAPGWRGDDDAKWERVADAMADFWRQHDRWPSATAKAADERRLGIWLSSTRQSGKQYIRGWKPERGAIPRPNRSGVARGQV